MSLLQDHIETVAPYIEMLNDVVDLANDGSNADYNASLAAGHIATIRGSLELVCRQTRLEAVLSLGKTGSRPLEPEHCEAIATSAVASELSEQMSPRKKLIAPTVDGYLEAASSRQSAVERSLGMMLTDAKQALAGDKYVVAMAKLDRVFQVTKIPELVMIPKGKAGLPKPVVRISPGHGMKKKGSNSDNQGGFGHFDLSSHTSLSSYMSLPEFLAGIKREVEATGDNGVSYEMLCEAEFYYQVMGIDLLPETVRVIGEAPSEYTQYKQTYYSVMKRDHNLVATRW